MNEKELNHRDRRGAAMVLVAVVVLADRTQLRAIDPLFRMRILRENHRKNRK